MNQEHFSLELSSTVFFIDNTINCCNLCTYWPTHGRVGFREGHQAYDLLLYLLVKNFRALYFSLCKSLLHVSKYLKYGQHGVGAFLDLCGSSRHISGIRYNDNI